MRSIYRYGSAALLLLSALPLSHTAPPSRADDFNESIIIGERVAALEEFRRQQRDWNEEIDHRLSGGINDLSKGQGSQDARIASLESRLDTLYRLGVVGGFIISVLSPIAWSAYNKRHNAVMKLSERLTKVMKLEEQGE